MENDSHSALAAAPDWGSLIAVLGVNADWGWEQDTAGRFTRLAGKVLEGDPEVASEQLLGCTRWDIGLQPVSADQNWDIHRKLFASQQPFRDLILRRDLSDGTLRYISISGLPCYAEDGQWTGYRGFGKDVTEGREQFPDMQRFQTMVDASPDCIYLIDAETQQILYANDTACQVNGVSRQVMMNLRGHQLSGRTWESAAELYTETIAADGEGVIVGARLNISKDGKRRGYWESVCRAAKLDGRWMIVIASREVSRRVLAERAVDRSKRMYAALSQTNEAIMRARSPDELYQSLCDAAVGSGGLTLATVLMPRDGGKDLHPVATAGLGKKIIRQTQISVDAERPEGQGLNGMAFRSGKPSISNDFINDPRTKHWHEMAEKVGLKAGAVIPMLRDGKAVGTFYLCAGERRAFDEEIVELLQHMVANVVFGLQNLEHQVDRERAEERVRYLATHDSLTGLPNRAVFGELLDQAVASARRYNQRPAVLFIDLDRFKQVNDTLGHAAGDALLKELASRMRGVLRESDVLARLGGDEFVILLQNANKQEDAVVVARKLLAAAVAPVTIMGQECRVSASIGISLCPDHGENHMELMKNADTAMYVAKDKGKNGFEFYVPGLQSESNERLAMEEGLRKAMTNNEFSLHYQAKLDLRTNAITGVEALLRWHSPTLGNVPPQQFLPVCEENGSILSLGRWVLRTACKQNVEWQREGGLPPITMAVNLSARQFADPELLSHVCAALEESGMNPALLELELTESMVMLNPLKAIAIMTALRALGVRIALDDFGVGYSSLAQLKECPIDTLKLDRSLIRDVPTKGQDRTMTEAIINMARTLSLRVIAEGVETEAQESYLRSIACDESQGFFFSAPAPADTFLDLIKSHGVSRGDQDR